MKKIGQMTIDEMAAEIRSYEFRRDKGYAFISYSHRDREQVYPLVLSWLRAGYNIYIDLDFERHGSDSNWAALMLSTLSSRLCRLGVCFKSVHYRYSYASLLELLTMRGETVTNRHSGKALYVDSVALGTIPDDDEIPVQFREMYASSFQGMSSGMGEQFLGQNRREAELLQEGLDFWLTEAKTQTVLRNAITAGKMMSYIQDSYKAGYQDFYPQIAYLVKNWFISQDLNGNDYSLNSSMTVRFSRFSEVRVEQVRESLLPPEELWTPPVPTPVPSPIPAAGPGDSGLSGPPRLVRQTGEEIPLVKSSFLVGRSEASCDYAVLGNKGVSGKHVLFIQRELGWVVADQASTNGTFLNGRRLALGEEAPLQNGDTLRLGQRETFFFRQ